MVLLFSLRREEGRREGRWTETSRKKSLGKGD